MPNPQVHAGLLLLISRGALPALLLAAGLTSQPCRADPAHDAIDAALQREADYRVIAARCGTPAFEKQFFKQSKAAVAGGLVEGLQNAGAAEKQIESRRRNPLQLVATSADCSERLAFLKTLQQQRAKEVRTGRR